MNFQPATPYARGQEPMNDHPGPEGLRDQMREGIDISEKSAKVEKALAILRARQSQLGSMAAEVKKQFEQSMGDLKRAAQENQNLMNELVLLKGK